MFSEILSKRPRAATAGSQSGFTLIEMVVVVAILGMMLGLVVSRGPVRSQRVEIDAAARDIAGSLRLARSVAIAENRIVSFKIDVPHASVRTDDGPVRYLPGYLTLRVTAGMAAIGDRAMADIRFAPDGSSSGGRIELHAPGRRVQIGVDWLTGRVSIVDAG